LLLRLELRDSRSLRGHRAQGRGHAAQITRREDKRTGKRTDTHITTTATIVGLENPILAGPDVLIGFTGTLSSTRIVLEVNLRVREAGDATHCKCRLCCLCGWTFSGGHAIAKQASTKVRQVVDGGRK
jgi:hypothetical protein